MAAYLITTLQQAKRVITVVVGLTLLLLGLAMFLLPGPGLLVFLLGLILLSGEFVWARWLLRRVKGLIRKTGIGV